MMFVEFCAYFSFFWIITRMIYNFGKEMKK